MKTVFFTIFALSVLASCSGGSGGGSSSNDQNDPSSDNDPTSNNAKVECLKTNLNNLPADQKKVIELSANAVIKCKASKNDVLAFIKSREGSGKK